MRLLGGVGYWPYGVEQLRAVCGEAGHPSCLLPGDDQPDAELAAALGTLNAEAWHRLWQYCVQGGPGERAQACWPIAASLIGRGDGLAGAACPLLRAGLYWPGALAQPGRSKTSRPNGIRGAPVAAIVFYRALLQAGNLAPIDALVTRAARRRPASTPLPLYCASLKEPLSAEIVAGLLAEAGAGLVLNATGFAVSSPGAARKETPFDGADGPCCRLSSPAATRRPGRTGPAASRPGTSP